MELTKKQKQKLVEGILQHDFTQAVHLRGDIDQTEKEKEEQPQE